METNWRELRRQIDAEGTDSQAADYLNASIRKLTGSAWGLFLWRLDDAWQLLEVPISSHCDVDLCNTHEDFIKDGYPSYECSIDHYHNEPIVGRAQTPALAICYAWLAWREKVAKSEDAT